MTKAAKDREILVRDVIIFGIKLFLDGLKDFVVLWVSLGAAALDLVFPGEKRGHRFYSVMRSAERFDQWLSLYGATQNAEDDPEGLFGGSRAGDDTLLGRIEKMAKGHEEPA